MKPLTARPAESVALLAIAVPVYGFLKDSGVSSALAAVIAVVIGLVPLAISTWRDTRPEPGDPGDEDTEGGPVTEGGIHERQGIDHEELERAVNAPR